MHRSGLTILVALACMMPVLAQALPLAVTPARTETVVDADWRSYDRLELSLTRSVGDGGVVSCRFFFQTKQDVWFESEAELTCAAGEVQTFSLRLDDLSPDWRCRNARRTYGADVLRWVKRWGVQVRSDKPVTGSLAIGHLRLVPAKERALAVNIHRLPEESVAGASVPIRFRTENFRGNPFDASHIVAEVVCVGEGGTQVFPCYFKQDYVDSRHPGSGLRTVRQLERPVWQADALFLKPGTFELTLHVTAGSANKIVKPLGELLVGPAPSKNDGEQKVEGGTQREFEKTASHQKLFERRESPAWSQVDYDGPLRFWHVPLDWTSAWGHYTGAGEFDQLIAWRFEQMLSSVGAAESLPVLLFSEDELDDHGTYNWKDHPLRSERGGALERPADFFTSSDSRNVLLNRARYLLARYGHHKGFGGLLILTRRAEGEVLGCIGWLVAQIQDEFPGARILSSNPETPGRVMLASLSTENGWELDKTLGAGAWMRKSRSSDVIILRGSYPGASAIVLKQVQHMAGADALAFDVRTPPTSGSGFKALCFMRVDADTVFQSTLHALRSDDKNRLIFPLNDNGLWTCLQDENRKLHPYDLLNCREVGIRFFCDEPEDGALQFIGAKLLWPHKSDPAQKDILAITDLAMSQEVVPRYKKLEFDFLLNRVFRNPYDPEQIDVSIVVTDPRGETRTHPGFFNEPWALVTELGVERVVLRGEPSWKVRIAPSLIGTHQWAIIAKAGRETSRVSGEFDVIKSANRGYIRTSKSDPKWLEHGDGTFFYPIGHNLRSPNDTRAGLSMADAKIAGQTAARAGTGAYAKWFKQLHANGGNFARVWMSTWWLGLEWNQETPGYHGIEYYNQGNASRLDRILDLAEQEGVYLCLATINHGTLSSHVDSQWALNPLNKETQPGGYLRYATEFVSSRRAQKWHRNKMRYTVARWGYSTSIAWWSVMTEAEWVEPYFRSVRWVNEKTVPRKTWVPRPYRTSVHKQGFVDWMSDMGGYLKGFDMHPHMASVHFSHVHHGLEVWAKPHADVVHNNAYTNSKRDFDKRLFPAGSPSGIVDIVRAYGRFYDRYARNKPLFVGEWGGSPHRNARSHLVSEFHTGMWGMLVSRMSGVTGFWWWTLLDSADLYGAYAPISRFMAGEDRRGKNLVSQRAALSFPYPGRKHKAIWNRHGQTLAGRDELMAYLCIDAINQATNSVIPRGADDWTFPKSGLGKLNAPAVMTNGVYKVEYWNTFTGKVIDSATVTLDHDNRTIPIISHRVDLAIKMKRVRP